MLYLYAQLHASATHLRHELSTSTRRGRAGQRGSVTTEYVLWAVAVIAIVGIVVAAVKAYVTSQAGNLK